jgi:hypothetical protein
MPKLLPVVERPTASCCAPLATAPLSVNDAKTLAGQLKALADPARLRLLSLRHTRLAERMVQPARVNDGERASNRCHGSDVPACSGQPQ